MIALIFPYLLLGFLYIYYRVIKDIQPDYWSPIQPLAFIFIWPIVLIADIFRWINKIRRTSKP
jgi:hypothetical protein